MNNLRNIVERGWQVGYSHTLKYEGKQFYEVVGLQKWKGVYKVNVFRIDEEKMTVEEFEFDEYKTFNEFEEAIIYIQSNSQVSVEQLNVSKGQKFFNPEF